MQAHDRPVFAKLMAALGELYRKPLSNALIELYWSNLKQFDIQAVMNAVNTHIQNPDKGSFMPQPADLIFYLEGSTATQGMRAWAKVNHAIKHIGAYASVVFDDALIHVVINEMGGWIKLCEMKEEEGPFRAREFEKRYASYVMNKPKTYPKRLVGIVDASNSPKGFKEQLPMLVGDSDAALKIYSEGSDRCTSISYQPLSLESLKQEVPKNTLTDDQQTQSMLVVDSVDK